MADQMNFADMLMDQKLGMNEKLSKIHDLIDWSALEKILASLRTAQTGRPSYDSLKMLKAFYLQILYSLSDPGLEEALLDRLSFRRFCGFALDASTPDETTICRFRALVSEAGVMEKCFEEINRQLDERGVILRKGTLLDATIVPATHNPPPKSAGMGASHPRETGADWTKKNGKTTFGYKLHVGMDEVSGIVRKAVFTSAKIYESEVADDLISYDEGAVYGDKAYEHKGRRKRLKERGIKDRLMHRRHKHIKQLPHWQERRNHLIARRRAPVEAVFSAMKRIYRLARTRCYSFQVNATDMYAFLTVFNLKRAVRLT